MRTRATISDSPDDAPPTSPDAETGVEATGEPEGPERPERPKIRSKGKDGTPTADPIVPKPLRDIRTAESVALKDYLAGFGTQGSVRVRVNRTEPKIVRIQGKEVRIEGHLATLDEFITEEDIADRWGGGSFDLNITTRNDRGSYEYAGHRVVKISGEPRVNTPPEVATPASAPPAGDSPGLVREVIGVLRSELDHARKPEGIPPSLQVLLDQMRHEASQHQAEVRELREQLRQEHNKPPTTDPVKDRMFESLIVGESGRITSLRDQHASELRQTKELHVAEIRRLEDRHDRTLDNMRQSHEREIATIKATYEREISAVKSAQDVALSSAKATAELQRDTLKGEIQRLRDDLDSMRKERDALRDRKDKSLIDQVKDINALKDVLGTDDSDASTMGRVVEALPAVAETIGGIVASARGTAPTQAQAQARVQPQRPRVVANPRTGQRFVQAGNQLVPVKPKPKIVTNDAGAQIEAPSVEEPQLALLVNSMEQAFRRDEAPHIVAQTGRTFVPAEILSWIRDNDTEGTSGLELFLSRVAKLPSTSPLASQAGRMWLRQVGRALIDGGG